MRSSRAFLVWSLLLLLACASAAQAPQESAAPAAPAPAPAPPSASVEEAVRLETPTAVVHGTLLVPAGKGPHPVALFHVGSGPTDRNGNIAMMGPNNSLKYLAEGLASRGIASLRYDKRGIGQSQVSGVSETDLRFDPYVEDAAAWIRQLRQDARFSKIAVVGHSEGSLIGMLAARQAGADAFVSVAGPGRPAAALLRHQLRVLPPDLLQESERLLSKLEAGETTDQVPAALAMVFRPSVQPYLISWFRYDPAKELARLQIPVLIVQGTTDIQVEVAEAEALDRAKPEAELVVIEGMNHVLKEVPADQARQIASYSDATLPIAPKLVEAIAGFIQGLAAARPPGTAQQPAV